MVIEYNLNQNNGSYTREINMKKNFVFIIIGLLLLFVVSCGSDSKQKDLLNYLNVELVPLEAKESEIVDLYDSVTGDNFTDDETTYNILVNEIIPKTNKFIIDIEQVSPAESELQDIHEMFISGWNSQLSAFVLLLSAIEKQDFSIITSANDKLSAGRRELRDYNNALDAYAKKVNVQIVPK
jgi:hypothetical protein